MVRNKASNNKDFVPLTQYPQKSKRAKRNPPPKPKHLLSFNPLPLYNDKLLRRPDIPDNIDISNPLALFRLFFTDEVLNQLAEYTNHNIELNPTPEERQPKESPRV